MHGVGFASSSCSAEKEDASAVAFGRHFSRLKFLLRFMDISWTILKKKKEKNYIERSAFERAHGCLVWPCEGNPRPRTDGERAVSFFGKCVLRIMPEQGNGSLGTIAELVYLHRLYFASGSVLRFANIRGAMADLPAPLFYLYQHDGISVSARLISSTSLSSSCGSPASAASMSLFSGKVSVFGDMT